MKLHSYGERMKVGILARGLGTGINEEGHLSSRHIVKVGYPPTFQSLRKTPSVRSLIDLVIYCRDKCLVFKKYIATQLLHHADGRAGMRSDQPGSLRIICEPWRVAPQDIAGFTQTSLKLSDMSQIDDVIPLENKAS